MKKINIFIAVLFTALVLSLVSCKQPKDVNVVDDFSYSGQYSYNVTGTYTDGAEYTIDSGIVTVSAYYYDKGYYNSKTWNSYEDTNLTTEYYIYAQLNGKASGDTTYITKYFYETFYKLSGKIVIEDTDSITNETKYIDVSSRFPSGSPSDSTFVYKDDDEGINLTFTRR